MSHLGEEFTGNQLSVIDSSHSTVHGVEIQCGQSALPENPRILEMAGDPGLTTTSGIFPVDAEQETHQPFLGENQSSDVDGRKWRF